MFVPRPWLVASGFSALALVAAGCSSSGTSSSAPPAGGGTTVAVRSVSGSQVLVDASGRTLYFSQQEQAAGKALCVSASCHSVWTPLTVAAGTQPSGPTSVAGELSTMPDSGGTRQVLFKGAPLYTFALDHGAGQATGNGAHDSFDGTDFTWEAATVGAAMPMPPASSNPSSGGGGYGSGY